MPWFRKSVYIDNTIILYFLCLTTKILLCYYCRNFPNGQPGFPNMLILKKLGVNHPLTPQYSHCYGPGPIFLALLQDSMQSPKVWAEYRRETLATGVWGHALPGNF
jgi:hypothetical protein